MDRESLIGMWDVYAGSSHSELLLQPDGNYYHSLWGGAQSHWGSWSLNDQAGQSVIVLKLAGAQPKVIMGLYGPQPAQWPPVEQWALTAVQPDEVRFFGGIMLRRALPAQPSAPPAQPGAPPELVSAQPPLSVLSAYSAYSVPQPPPEAQLAEPSPEAAPAPPPPFSALAPYSAPPQPAAPDAHAPQILTQWQDANLAMYKTQQAANLQASIAQQTASVQAAMAQRQANLDAFSMNQTMNTNEFTAMQKATFDQIGAVHAGVQGFINTLK